MTYLGGRSDLRVVGTRPVRPDGVDKVTGRAAFGADLRLPGMLHGRIKRSPHAHARILRIDTARAAALPGVLAVVTSADFRKSRPKKRSSARGRSISAISPPTFWPAARHCTTVTPSQRSPPPAPPSPRRRST
jgi:CO/xanthine dehydrogenase Mo-binding subunit